MSLPAASRQLARRLQQLGLRIVLAESCTGGLASASLAAIPGISNHLCGSAVTYRNDTKQQWLGVSANLLRRAGPVSRQVARLMAMNVLTRTPEANWSASVTGHVGPNAPARLDGYIFIGVAQRISHDSSGRSSIKVMISQHQLTSRNRIPRQREAAMLVFRCLLDAIDETTSDLASR